MTPNHSEVTPKPASVSDGGATNRPATQQEQFWEGEFGDAYTERNAITPEQRAPFFQQNIEQYLKQLTELDEIIPFAENMLLKTEQQLLAFVNAGTEDDDDDEDEDEDEDLGPEELEERAVTISSRLARAYIGEAHYGYYEFLQHDQAEIMDAAKASILLALQARFGEPDPDPEFADRSGRNSDIHHAWHVKLQQTDWAGQIDSASELGLWLGLYSLSDSGDGDAWINLYLVCGASMDALDAARNIRHQGAAQTAQNEESDNEETVDIDDENTSEEDEQDASEESASLSYDEWMDEVKANNESIANVPLDMIDDALVDAALAADIRALHYVPAQWQTPARLEALIRKSVSIAVAIPPECMTTAALALARTLYADDGEWQWRDDKYSKKPNKWSEYSLDDIWAGLLTEEDYLLAMKGRGNLSYVAHWLRTEKVENAALDANIYNIRFVAKDKITPALALRVARNGNLIKVIPDTLLTSDLCLTSVRKNGASLEHIPLAMRTVEVCIAALRQNATSFFFVPEEVELNVLNHLIAQDLEKIVDDAGPVHASIWHGHRAWVYLWHEDYEAAIADAKLALQVCRYQQHAHYVIAYACKELGRMSEATLEAATVLSMQDPYVAEFNSDEDTSWLYSIRQSQFDGVDEATLLAMMASHPLSLANLPRTKINEALIAAALTADPAAIEFVPKRFMNAERYTIALKRGVKQFMHIPRHMLSEEACIEHVSIFWTMSQVPEEWKTVTVCAHALTKHAPHWNIYR